MLGTSPRRSLQGALFALSATSFLSLASAARAEQFTIVEETWTHDASDKDSHHYVNPSADTPHNLVSPVDYSNGSVHVVLDVKTKPPGNTPTKFQVCFEGSPSYDCTAQSPTYTTTGQVVWSTDVQTASFYKGDGGGLDFTKPIKRVALILKDTMNNKPSPDNVDAAVAAMYTPTDLHIEVVWVSAGSKYVPPTHDAGAPDASVHPTSDASITHGEDASTAEPDASAVDASAPVSASLDAALPSGASGHDASVDGSSTTARRDAGDGEPTASKHDDGCNLSRASLTPSPWLLGVLSVLTFAWLRRRRGRAGRADA